MMAASDTRNGFNLMTKPKGGRGQKAEHPTKIVRVPIGISRSVSRQSELYRQAGSDVAVEIASIILEYKQKSKDTRDWTQLNEMIHEIEGYLPPGTLEWLGDATE